MFALCVIILSAESQAKKRGCSIVTAGGHFVHIPYSYRSSTRASFLLECQHALPLSLLQFLSVCFFFSTNVSVTLITQTMANLYLKSWHCVTLIT